MERYAGLSETVMQIQSESTCSLGGICRYLKEHHRVRYYNFLTSGTLDNYLADVESQAENLFEQTVKTLVEKENVAENLKATLPMEWVGKMNNIRNRATEIVDCAFCSVGF